MKPTETNTVRIAQSAADYDPSAKQKAAAKLSRIPIKVQPGEVLRRPAGSRAALAKLKPVKAAKPSRSPCPAP